MYGSVKVWQEIISLPTWTTGAEDPNPMFLEKTCLSRFFRQRLSLRRD